jgi:hypothetical protein
MSLFAHHAATHPAPQDFALVQTRYLAVPALLWGLAMIVAIVFTIAQGAAADAALRGAAVDDGSISAYGA